MGDHQLSKADTRKPVPQSFTEDTKLGILLLYLLKHSNKRLLESSSRIDERMHTKWGSMLYGGACDKRSSTI